MTKTATIDSPFVMIKQELEYIGENFPTLQSDYARYNAKVVAELASRGYITCVQGDYVYNYWFLTGKGVKFLWQSENHKENH